ncbi:MAG TPA: group 1 truncated hemoglobin [Candidatus Saccharimonadia bacterium]|nr:group 1 truncated hemoglobin [Candidatus Saccharimonadia bacterium]
MERKTLAAWPALIPALVALTLSACAATPPRTATLWDALGRDAGTGRVIDGTLRRAHDDPAIADLFADTDDAYLKARLLEQICAATGGGCTYTGLPMDEAHSGMAITPAEFGRFVAHLAAAMDEAGVPPDTQSKLIALLAPMQPEIVGQ